MKPLMNFMKEDNTYAQHAHSKMVNYPLDPLTAVELELAVSILRREKGLDDSYRFASINLLEPSKNTVLNYKPGEAVEREAFCILLHNREAKTYEAVVSITDGKVKSWTYIPGVQPSVLFDEFMECQQAVKDNSDMQAAFAKRGITDMNNVMVEPWSAGNFGMKEEEQIRMVRAICYYKTSPEDNGYARPISGLHAFVDLNRMEVIKVVDKDAISFPPLHGNYSPDQIGGVRNDLKPLEIIQPEGPSFAVNGHEISWQKWEIRFGFTSREGLVLNTVTYHDKEEDRACSISCLALRMVVPYWLSDGAG